MTYTPSLRGILAQSTTSDYPMSIARAQAIASSHWHLKNPFRRDTGGFDPVTSPCHRGSWCLHSRRRQSSPLYRIQRSLAVAATLR